MSRAGNIRVAIFDPVPAFSRGLVESIAGVPGLVCVATASTEQEAWSILTRARPDVLVVAAAIKEIDLATFVRHARYRLPRIKLLVLGDPWLDPFPARLLRIGVSGYLLKDCSANELVKALRAISQGKTYVSSSVATVLVQQIHQVERHLLNSSSPWPSLTERESEILELLANGRSNPAIAMLLQVSVRTVENHVQNIYRKLGVHHRADAVRLAFDEGFVTSLVLNLSSRP
jgi:DNA-binding NarL/FixJ family response regulator